MTLLESVIALVILSLSAIGVLELFQQANRSASQAQEWTLATAYAEQGMEVAKIGDAALRDLNALPLKTGYLRQIRTKPALRGLVDMEVVVALPAGASFALHRLMPVR